MATCARSVTVALLGNFEHCQHCGAQPLSLLPCRCLGAPVFQLGCKLFLCAAAQQHMATTTENDHHCKSQSLSANKHHADCSGPCFKVTSRTNKTAILFECVLHVNVLAPRCTWPLQGPTSIDCLATDPPYAVPPSQTQHLLFHRLRHTNFNFNFASVLQLSGSSSFSKVNEGSTKHLRDA